MFTFFLYGLNSNFEFMRIFFYFLYDILNVIKIIPIKITESVPSELVFTLLIDQYKAQKFFVNSKFTLQR